MDLTYLRVCLFCGCYFMGWRNALYCEEFCEKGYRRARRLAAPEPDRLGMVLTESGKKVREVLRKNCPRNALGWLAIEVASQIRYPLNGRSRRFCGRLASVGHLSLSPVPELPRIAMAGAYRVAWVLADSGTRVTELIVVLDYAARIDPRNLRRTATDGGLPTRFYTKKAFSARIAAAQPPATVADAAATIAYAELDEAPALVVQGPRERDPAE